MPEAFERRCRRVRPRPVLRVFLGGLLLLGVAAGRSPAQEPLTAAVTILDGREISNPRAKLVVRQVPVGSAAIGELKLVLINDQGSEAGSYGGSFEVQGRTLTARVPLHRSGNDSSYARGRLELLPGGEKLNLVLKETAQKGGLLASLQIGAVRTTEVEVRRRENPQEGVDLVLPGQVDLTSAEIRSAILQQPGSSAPVDCRLIQHVLRCSPKAGVATPQEGILQSEICARGLDGLETCRIYVSKGPLMFGQPQPPPLPPPQPPTEGKLLTVEVLKGPDQNPQLVLSGSGVKAPASGGMVTWETTPSNALQPAMVNLYVGPDKKFQTIVPVRCPAAEVTLQQVTLTLPGDRVPWPSVGPLPLCPALPSPWEVIVRRILEIFFTLVLLASLTLLGWFLFSENRKKNKQREEHPPPSKDVNPPAQLQGVLEQLNELVGEVQRVPDQVAKRLVPEGEILTTPAGTLPVVARRAHDQQVEQAERAMLNLVNSWWEEGGRDRKELSQRIQSSGLPLQQYRSVGLDATLTVVTNRTFGFAPATDSNPAEWLWYARGDREVLALPLDARLFEAGSAMVVVALLFEGLGNRPPAKLSFRRADRACRLTPVPGERDRYSLKEPGLLQVTDRSGQPLREQPPSPGARRPEVLPPPRIPDPAPASDFERILAPLRALPQRWESPLSQLQSLVNQLQLLVAERNRLQELPLVTADLLSAVEQLRGEVHDLACRPAAAPSPPKSSDPRSLAPQLDVVPQTATPVLKDESGGADFSRELTRQTEPELSRAIIAAAEELQGRLQPILANLPVPRRVDLRPAMYLERLTAQWDGLSRWQEWAVDLVHFQAATGTRHTDGFLRLAEANIEGAGRFRVEGVLFEETFTIQLALRIRSSHTSCIGLLVAPGATVDKYKDSFSRLTRGRLPDGLAVISAVRLPAILQPEPGHGNKIWRVVLPLQVDLI